MQVNSRGDIGAGVKRTVPTPKPAPKPTQKASPKPTPKPKPAASSVSYGHRVTVEKEAQPRVTVKPTQTSKPAPVVSYGRRVIEERAPQPKVASKPAQTSKPTPTVSYGHRVKEERDPQPRVASKPSSSSQPVVTYGKRVTAGKSNGESIYESYKQPYAKPTGYSMDVKVDGVGKKPENRSILNTVDSGISKSNSSNKGTTVVTYSNNKGNSYLRDKREEMYGGMKGDIQKDVPSININNNSGYIAAKKEQISAKMKEDKQSTYSIHDKYTKDNYINNKKAEISKGMKGDIQKDTPSINKNNNSGYIAVKKEQISTKIKEDKQSTYSIYDKYMKDNYINNKRAEIFAGINVKATSNATGENKAIFKIIKNSYSKPFRDMNDNFNNIHTPKKSSPEIIRAATSKEIRAKEWSDRLPYLPVINMVNDMKISLSGTDLCNQCKNEREIMDSKVSTMATIATLYAGAAAKSVGTTSMNSVNGLAEGGTKAETPKIGQKLEYVFGNATGTKHNIERSIDMERQLNRIGIFNNVEGRAYMQQELEKAFYDTTNGTMQSNGRILKESLLTGPNGVVKVQSVWEGNRLVTVEIFGGGE